MEETGVPEENHRPVDSQVTDKLYHIVLYRVATRKVCGICMNTSMFLVGEASG